MPWIYSSSAAALQTVLPARLFRLIGASEVDDTICAATYGKAWDEMFPNMLSADPLDVVHAQLIVVWGSNPAVSNTHFPPLVRRAQQAGAQLVVVDPRRTAMAKRADLHVTPRPGHRRRARAGDRARARRATDALDRAFLAAHAEGVDAFLAAADEWTLARAEAVTGVAAAVIARLAGLLADVRPAYFRVGWGLERNAQRWVGVRRRLRVAGAHRTVRRAGKRCVREHVGRPPTSACAACRRPIRRGCST